MSADKDLRVLEVVVSAARKVGKDNFGSQGGFVSWKVTSVNGPMTLEEAERVSFSLERRLRFNLMLLEVAEQAATVKELGVKGKALAEAVVLLEEAKDADARYEKLYSLLERLTGGTGV